MTNPNSLGTAAYMLFQTLQHDSTVYFSFDKEEKRRGGRERERLGKGQEGKKKEKKRNPEQQKIDSIPA